MTRPLDKPNLRTAHEAMRRASVVEDVYVALKTLLGQWERHRWLCEWGEIALQSHPDAEPRQRLQRHVNDIAERVVYALLEEGMMWRDLEHIPHTPWDSTPHCVRDVTADLIDAPAHGDVLTLLHLLQDRYSSDEQDEEVAV